MAEINDGGPAFPLQDNGSFYGSNGMSLRDYFAIHAPHVAIDDMISDSIAVCSELLGIPAGEYQASVHYPILQSRCRYQYADAMLKARKVKP